MSYTALYRKFRPRSFDDVKGQDAIVTTLKNQIKAERIGHAYLFCGTRGTGKTTVAKILAKTVNCEHTVDGNPCNECEMCREIDAGNSLNVIEIDAASNNGVDNIREIREEVEYRPANGKYKVYIIDEVHMLSTGAFNALLKTLEEPPSYVIFILATTEAHKIPVTILSRCQRYDFKRISMDTIESRMRDLMNQEKVDVEDRALAYIAKAADGSMRDALSLLDQCIAFHFGQTLTYDKVLEVLGAVDAEVFSLLLRRILDGDVAGTLHILDQMLLEGKEITQFVVDFTWYLRNLLLVKTSEDPKGAVDVSSEQLRYLQEESGMAEVEMLIRYIRILSDLSMQLRLAVQKRVLVEVALIKLCRPQMETDLSSVLDRMRMLEEKIEGIESMPLRAGAVAQGQGNDLETKQTQPVKHIPLRAASEDLQRIKQEWSMIVGQMSGFAKTVLKDAKLKYDDTSAESRLYVELQTNAAVAFAHEPEHTREVEHAVEERFDRHVDVELYVKNSESGKQLSDISIDDRIKQNIKMPVDIED